MKGKNPLEIVRRLGKSVGGNLGKKAMEELERIRRRLRELKGER